MTSRPRILVIDDEPQILRALQTILGEKHFQVLTASNGEDGLALAAAGMPDLIILDLGLPDIDGIEVCGRLREWTDTPIIVLSVRENEREKVRALDKGADDYLTKPFGIEELLARVRVALRHRSPQSGSKSAVITAGPITLDLARHIVTRNELEVKLTSTEFNLLAYLASHADRVLTHQSILTQVWGEPYSEQVEYLRVYMRQLRKKLEDDPHRPKYILNEPGVGYRFVILPE
jgi:two-component system KDP operon response regulator KdpE